MTHALKKAVRYKTFTEYIAVCGNYSCGNKDRFSEGEPECKQCRKLLEKRGK